MKKTKHKKTFNKIRSSGAYFVNNSNPYAKAERKAKQKQRRLQKRQERRRKSFFRNIDWSIFYFDPIRVLGRSYYFINAAIFVLLDIFVLIKIFFNTGYILLTIPLTYFSIKAFASVILDNYYRVRNKIYNNELENSPRVKCASGAPGAGKTSSKGYEAVELAKINWRKLKNEHFFCCCQNPKKLKGKALAHYNEVMEAYNFEIKSKNKIHCLWSLTELKHGKRTSHKLTKEHLLQKERLPYLAVAFSDEIGSLFPARKGPTEGELLSLSMFARWIRHYIDGFWTFTEQDFSKAFIDIRRVTGSNQYFHKQKWMLRPKFLIRVYNFILNIVLYPLQMMFLYKAGSPQFERYEKSLKRYSKVFSKFLKGLKRLIYCVGWRQYTYEERIERTESSQNIPNGILRKTYLPACLNHTYYDRAYMNAYLPINKQLYEKDFSGELLTREEIKKLFDNEEFKKLFEETLSEEPKKETTPEPKKRGRKKKEK